MVEIFYLALGNVVHLSVSVNRIGPMYFMDDSASSIANLAFMQQVRITSSRIQVFVTVHDNRTYSCFWILGQYVQ